MFGREIILDTMASMTDINGDYILYRMMGGEILKRIPKKEICCCARPSPCMAIGRTPEESYRVCDKCDRPLK